MPQLETIVVDTLELFTSTVQNIQRDNGESVWYRGCCNTQHKLLPSLYRHPDNPPVQELLVLEQKLLTRFKQRSIPYLARYMSEDWEYLFLMQHHGVPTRLLDWTENPYIALFFALEKVLSSKQGPNGLDAAAVWILDPGAWNKEALTHISFSGGILSTEDIHVKGFAPTADLSLMNNNPLAIYGAHNSPRIIAQRGTFTVFGKDCRPLETIYENGAFPETSLTKIELPADHLPALKDSLIKIGTTSSVVFPDLDGLAKDLRWFFGFGR